MGESSDIDNINLIRELCMLKNDAKKWKDSDSGTLVKTLSLLGDKYKTILRIVNEVDRNTNNNNIDKALVYHEKFIPLIEKGVIEAKGGGLTISEIGNYFNKASKIKQFTGGMLQCVKLLDQVKTKIDFGEKVVDTLCNLVEIENGKRIKINGKLPESAEIRAGFKEATRRMTALMSIVQSLTDIAPPGMKDYLQYNLSAFKAATVLFKITDEYCVKIENLLADIEKQEKANQTSRNSKDNVIDGIKHDTRKESAEASYLLH